MRQDSTLPRPPAAPPGPLQLHCPCCGRSKGLSPAHDWPAGLARVEALCMDCSGHGNDSTTLIYSDGRVVTEPARAH